LKTIDSLLKEKRVFSPPKEFSKKAYLKSLDELREVYQRSAQNLEGFWAEKAGELIDWYEEWEKVLEYSFSDEIYVKWFINGKLNASYNCLDRHTKSARRNKTAFIWERDDGKVKKLTYQELYEEVNKFAQVLRALGVKKGDRVAIYLPMVLELPIAMLACARLGAVHSVVFGGFSAEALKGRINDCGAKVLITADEGVRGGRYVPLKKNADEALLDSPSVEKVLVVKRTGREVYMKEGRDFWWDEEMAKVSGDVYVEPAKMDAEDPLFILYTSGSTGKPKGVIHTTGGYLVYTSLTFKWVFDYHEKDVFFCTADIGWITGHSYIVYGPLAQGATSLIFEGKPTYPQPDRFWKIVDKHGVTIFYTAPTAIRALMREGDNWVKQHDLSTLRLLGTVGEPINPEAWMWYYKVVGRERCPVVDTWWQTETGGILIAPLPGATPLKPGSANLPFPGIFPKVLREDGSEAGVNEGGYLVIEKPWPGMLRGMWGDLQNTRFKETYFTRFPSYYFTGDGARLDEDGYFWLMGRIDDVLNVSGHRLGTAEIESALVTHEAVAEAAVVGFPHLVKGDGIYAYVVLKEGFRTSQELKKALIERVREVIGPIARPDVVQFTPGLPKTRSGKIMRRILRKIASGERENLGDTSTLADPSIVKELVASWKTP
jgi:acetyl-CoA synthetase